MCCLFWFHRGPIFVRLSFPTPTIGTTVCSGVWIRLTGYGCQSGWWSAEKGIFFHCCVLKWEFGLARQFRLSRPASASSLSYTPRDFSSFPQRRPFLHTANRHRVRSLSFIKSRNDVGDMRRYRKFRRRYSRAEPKHILDELLR